MHFTNLLTTALLATSTALAAPTTVGQSRSRNFHLIAHVQGTHDLKPTIEGRAVGAFRLGPADAGSMLYQVLPRTGSGLEFYLNGTDAQVAAGTANTLYNVILQTTDGHGNPKTLVERYGLLIGIEDRDGRMPVAQAMFKSSPGIQQKKSEGVGAWHYKAGRFYACHGTPYPVAKGVELFWRNATETTPKKCAEVDLYPQCMNDPEAAKRNPHAQYVNCYKDVAAHFATD
jgi:hypothetical protein